MLETSLDFIRDPLVLLPNVSVLLIVSLGQRVQVLLMPHFLLFFRDLQRPDILFELPLSDPVFILGVLEGDLGILLELGQLVLVIED